MTRRSFTSALFWRFFLLAVIPLVAIGVLAGSEATRSQRESVGWRNTVEAAAVKAEVDAFLSAPVAALTQLAHIADNPQARELLGESLLDHFPAVESVVLVDTSGKSVYAGLSRGVAGNAQDFVGIDRSNDPLFEQAIYGSEPVWSGVFTSMQSGRRVVGVGVPLEKHVAIATINIERLSDAVERTTVGEGSVIVVTDAQGTVLFHTDPELAAARPNWRNVEPISDSVKGSFGQSEYWLEGTSQLGSTIGVSGAGWTVLVQQSRAVAMRSVNAIWSAIFLGTITMACLSAVAATLFSRSLSQPVSELSEFAAQVERGEETSEPASYNFVEMEGLGHSIASMALAVSEREAELRTARDELIDNQSHLQKTVAERESAFSRLSRMSAQLTATEERERRRLAEDLHDRVSQPLAVARMRLGLVSRVGPEEASQLRAVDSLLAEAITQTRAITTELAPPILYELGLAAAVGGLADEMSATFGITVNSDIEVDDTDLSDEAKMALYRAAREFLANVVKHSGSKEASLTLRSDAHTVILSVADQGTGFEPEAEEDPTRFGLFSLRERISQLGGHIKVESRPGEGTTVYVEVPRGHG